MGFDRFECDIDFATDMGKTRSFQLRVWRTALQLPVHSISGISNERRYASRHYCFTMGPKCHRAPASRAMIL